MRRIQINSVGKSGNCSQGSGWIPYSEWVKMTKKEHDAVFAKRSQERMASVDFNDSGDGYNDNDNGRSCLPTRLDKSHHVEIFIKFWHQSRHLISRINAR
jgi:hypothetical protein